MSGPSLSGVLLRLLPLLIVITGVSSCAAGEGRIVDVRSVQIGESESSLKKSSSAFAFAPNGHFGDKVQYNGKEADEFGGSYAIHCRARKAFGIEVKYPDAGVSVSDAKLVLRRLLPESAGSMVASDAEDLGSTDVKVRCEFIYYKNKVRAELTYCPDSKDKVRELSLWLCERGR